MVNSMGMLRSEISYLKKNTKIFLFDSFKKIDNVYIDINTVEPQPVTNTIEPNV